MRIPPRFCSGHAVVFASCCVLLAAASAREWTSNDGKKLEAEFVSATAEAVVLKRSADGNSVTLPMARLSAADREHVRNQGLAPSPAAESKPLDGPHAGLVTGDWALSTYKSKTFKYTEFPNGGHGISEKVFNDEAVHVWLFAQGGKK